MYIEHKDGWSLLVTGVGQTSLHSVRILSRPIEAATILGDYYILGTVGVYWQKPFLLLSAQQIICMEQRVRVVLGLRVPLSRDILYNEVSRSPLGPWLLITQH